MSILEARCVLDLVAVYYLFGIWLGKLSELFLGPCGICFWFCSVDLCFRISEVVFLGASAECVCKIICVSSRNKALGSWCGIDGSVELRELR